jgi:hypothetical protein
MSGEQRHAPPHHRRHNLSARLSLRTLRYDNGEKNYEMQQTIQPGDQMWVNLAQLVRQRIPDRKGNTLPVDVSSVTYDLRDLTQRSHSLTMGELAVGGTWGFQAVQPACPECCGQDVLGFSPDPVDLATGNTDTVAIDGVEACNGDPEVLTAEFSDWSSGNSSIASVSYAKVKGLAAGSTTGYANGLVQVPGACACNLVPAQTYVPITVQVPAALSVLSSPVISMNWGLGGCVGAPYGIFIAIHYQVLDQTGAPMANSNLEPQEEILNYSINGSDPFNPDPNWVDIGPTAYPGTSQYTDTNGQFYDAPFGICTSSTFAETFTQPISILMNGTNYTVRANNWKTTSTAPGHGSTTNGSDISQSR